MLGPVPESTLLELAPSPKWWQEQGDPELVALIEVAQAAAQESGVVAAAHTLAVGFELRVFLRVQLQL